MRTSIEQAAKLAEGFGAMSLTSFQPSLRPGSGRSLAKARLPLRCPPGYGYFLINGGGVFGPYDAVDPAAPGHWECRPLPHMTPSPAGSAGDTLRQLLMSTALPANQGRAPRGGGGGGTQVSSFTMHGLPEGLGMAQAAGLGAIFNDTGLGIPGPYGAVPSQKIDAGTYEITGTQVALRGTPNGAEAGRFNNKYGANNNLVVEPADQVDFDGQVGNAGGLSWGHVTVKTGELAGKTGYVALEYVAPVGWTKQHGGTGPISGGGGGIQPASSTTDSTSETDYVPYILGGAAVVGAGVIIWALAGGKHKGKHGKRHAARHRRRHA
jgi:hypothetical protein